ncbi:MAG TPA: heme-copper oxidase subunit III [Acidimicrobiales bacterium]|nr:heme-copper oxidase subunit III [Acidimicrobiales bacterium]
MTAISAATAPPAHPARSGPVDYRPALVNVGTIVWLASELMFFSGLFAAYLTLRAASPTWPPFHDMVDAKTVGVATIVLVASSFTMQVAVWHVHQHNLAGFRIWLAFTWALGSIFEGMQVVDYATRNFSLQQSAYSGGFYLLTGIHFLHVLGGLAAMVFMMLRSLNPRIRFGGHRSAPHVEMLSYYWHFVDVVWVGLYAMIFLLPSTKP